VGDKTRKFSDSFQVTDPRTDLFPKSKEGKGAFYQHTRQSESTLDQGFSVDLLFSEFDFLAPYSTEKDGYGRDNRKKRENKIIEG